MSEAVSEGREAALEASDSTVISMRDEERSRFSEGGVMLRVDRIRPGAVVILYLKEPKERFWGVLRSLDGTGVSALGLDLYAFDDWLRQVAGEGTSGITPSLVFYPLHRVEKILLDMPSGQVPSLLDQFESRTGRDLMAYLGLPESG